MKTFACILLLAVPAVLGEKADARRPITKVVNLLQGMQDQLNDEMEKEDKMNRKMNCWCDANKEQKTRIIAESTETIEAQTTAVAENTALGERLRLEIRKLNQEINKSKATLETARVLREDQRKSFAEDEDKIMKNINAVERAEAALGNGATGFLQSKRSESPKVAVETLKKIVDDNWERIRAQTTRADRMELQDFLEDPSQFTKSSTGLLQRSEVDEPQSGVIDGLLKNMIEDFTDDLTAERTKDKEMEKSYKELVAAMNSQIAANEESVDAKEEQKAKAAEDVIQGKKDIKAATAAKEDSESYLVTVNSKCADFAAEYKERSATRNEEFQAVTKAMEVLNSDDAHATFGRSLSFLQISDASSSAAALLRAKGKQLGSQALISLSIAAQKGAFDKVNKAIEDMVAALKKEQVDEIKLNDECTAEFNDNELSNDEKTRVKGSVESKISSLKSELTTTLSDMKKLSEEVDGLENDLKEAGENRDDETSEFKKVVVDQHTTQQLLKKALASLRDFYSASLVQVQKQSKEEVEGVPVENFKKFQKNKGGTGVITLLQQILEDSMRMEKEAKEGEEASQKDFDELSAKTNAEIDSKNHEIELKQRKKSNLEVELSEQKTNLRDTKDDLAALAATKLALHQKCDFMQKNFELRQKARTEELEAINEAKTILMSSPAGL
mmetsp:Transcript_85468/g.151156  ORF Transcript_85468/g.151156 Transcript_85468/m.151156 type:complete len:673 (-) Transcript_85468:70-2088(-)